METTGSHCKIEWYCKGFLGPDVRIEFYKGGLLNRLIIDSIEYSQGINSVGFDLYLDQTLGNDYKIRITSPLDPSWYDESDNYFTITNCIDMGILLNYIGQWKRGEISMSALMIYCQMEKWGGMLKWNKELLNTVLIVWIYLSGVAGAAYR